MQKNNLVRKIICGASGLALLVSLEGCGTTIQHRDPQTNVWYDCNTNTDYLSEHPCNPVVAKYNAEHRSSSSSSSGSSSYWSGKDYGAGFDKGGHDCSDHCSGKGGHH